MTESRDVLVVEDDATLNSIVCRFIKLAGFTPRSALDGDAALRAVRVQLPALVLLDLMLPDITGFEVCEQIKRDALTTGVPIIMVTAMADDESRTRGLQCGAVAYLTKPFDPDQLIEVIRKHAA